MNDQELLRAYADPRYRAVLGVLRDAEGTSKYGDPYRVAGGGKATLSQLQTPTFELWGFKDKSGNTNKSSATGAYQFLGSTWKGLQDKYGFTDFSPRSQDLAALALLKDAGAFPYIDKGDYLGALHQARRIWASLPGAGYNQSERSKDYLVKSLEKHLGSPLKMHEQSNYQTASGQFTQQPTQPNISIGDISPQQNEDPYAKLFNVDVPPSVTPVDQPVEIVSGRKNTKPVQPFVFYE